MRRSIDVPQVLVRVVPDAPPAAPVVRPRLERVLDGGAQVVAITAPAGYGKSALVATWLANRPQVTAAWLSLDGVEATGLAVWRGVVDAIARVDPEVAEVGAMITESSLAGRAHVAALVRAIRARRAPLVLVIDDLHLAADAAVRDDLTLLMERCAPQLRLVAIGRTEPPLPMARWRADGRAVELRAHDLAFTADEAVALLAPLGVDASTAGRPAIDEQAVARLVAHTEGWAIGLLLGALSREEVGAAADAADEALAAGRQLTDYLIQEVLDRLDPELATFALEMSVPPWFDLHLLHEITGHPASASMYGTLVRASPFIIDLGGGTARFHHLIRSLLRAELRWRSPERWVELHRAAAAAMRRRDRIDVAIDLLLQVGDIDECVDLIAAPVLSLMDAGKLRELIRWVQLLPPVQPNDPIRMANYALVLTVVGRTDLAEATALRMGDALRDGDPRHEAMQRLRSLQAMMQAAVLTAAGRTREASPLLPTLIAAGTDRAGSEQIDARLSGQITRLSLLVGELDVAAQWIPEVERHRSAPLAQVHGPALRAWWWLAQGRADRALTAVEPAIAAAERLGMRPHPAATDADIVHAQALLAQLRLREAAVAIERIDADADALSWPFFLLRTWPLQVQFRALDEGWPAAVDVSLSLTTTHLHGRGGDLVDRVAEVQAHALTAVGRLDEAAERVEMLPPSRRRDLAIARLHSARGDRAAAHAVLGDLDGWGVCDTVEALLVLASAADDADGGVHFEQALRLAAPGGWWAPFALEVGAVPALMDRLAARLPPALAQWQAARATPALVVPLTLLDPITTREAAVLELLPSHLTYQAIGAELYVSVNTVKTYVSAIYRKLGVSSRGEAVRAARAAGLLE
jgi:LuxR family maltose regulon positive regulatory protein